MTYIAYALFTLGCFVSLLNLYLSVGRYPLLRWRGIPADDIRHVSGFPLVGSLLVVLTLGAITNPAIWWLGLVIAFLDTGGLHMFGIAMLVAALRGKL